MQSNMHFIVIGGGAAGFFAAITAAECHPSARVTILERGTDVLQKVRISGGGRCNVTHHCPDARELVKNYPRGNRELLAPFLRFGTQQTVDWFEQRGVPLKIEADGRMFPTSDDSSSIVNCLVSNALKNKVEIRTGVRIDKIVRRTDGIWQIFQQKNEVPLLADAVLVATGSSTAVWQMLAQLGHRIVEPVPSLFTFNTHDTRLRDLAGVSVPHVRLKIADEKLTSEGAILVTHWGLSGPAVLKLSAWGARELHQRNYRFQLIINWLNDLSEQQAIDFLKMLKPDFAQKKVRSTVPRIEVLEKFPLRLWQNLCTAAGINEEVRWAELDKNALRQLAVQLCQCPFAIAGKSTFKEEFVTAGGVDLREVNFKRFESKLFPRLFFAGEVLNIDAVTGGFNFQAAWTGGWTVGHAVFENW